MFLEICMQIYSVVFALRRQINKQKYAKTINLLCKTNKDFVKHQSQRGGRFNTNPPQPPPLAYALDSHNTRAAVELSFFQDNGLSRSMPHR